MRTLSLVPNLANAFNMIRTKDAVNYFDFVTPYRRIEKLNLILINLQYYLWVINFEFG